jgi:aerobic-type carbon monoxide dehydrogenase small subunit (CoxS/CutS family)
VPDTITFRVDGHVYEVADDGASLLDVLRDRLGLHVVKDGCAPQGQCGCCTVLVDDQPRVACVTPARRVAGRSITTAAGLPDEARDRWATCLVATGGSQCGFCTPGIVVRLHGLIERGAADRRSLDQALLAHLCRCTGWQTIRDAASLVAAGTQPADRDLDAAARRAGIEGHTPQGVGPGIALGQGGFADDTAPPDALVAVRAADGSWVVGDDVLEARARAGKVQGRRTTVSPTWPIEVPAGDWVRVLRTTWVEPAYLEPDAAWCEPGGRPASPLANGGAFGGKVASEAGAIARRLADAHGRAVRVRYSREDVVRLGPKRPPLAAGIRADGSGAVRVARTEGIVDAIAAIAPGLAVEVVDVPGPPTSVAVRGAGWAEAAVLESSLHAGPDDHARDPGGGEAWARVDADGVHVRVRCGQPLDEVTLRSYCIGAVHQALGWVRNEAISVDEQGEPQDLTIRSFGILRAADMPTVHVTIEPDDTPPVNGSDAVFAATAAASWRAAGYPDRWPCTR